MWYSSANLIVNVYVWFINNYHKSWWHFKNAVCFSLCCKFYWKCVQISIYFMKPKLYTSGNIESPKKSRPQFCGYFVIILLLKKCLRHQNKSWNRLATAKILYNNENNFQILRNSFWVCNSCQTLAEKFRISHQVCLWILKFYVKVHYLRICWRTFKKHLEWHVRFLMHDIFNTSLYKIDYFYHGFSIQ